MGAAAERPVRMPCGRLTQGVAYLLHKGVNDESSAITLFECRAWDKFIFGIKKDINTAINAHGSCLLTSEKA